MKCQFCDRVVTQAEADAANAIRPCELTQCEECATVTALADEHESACFEDEGEAAFGRPD